MAKNLSATLRVVRTYLEYSGYNVEYISFEDNDGRLSVVKDGHWLQGWCLIYGTGNLCPCGIPVTLKNLCGLLEAGPPALGEPSRVSEFVWRRADSLMALAAGGYESLWKDD